MVTKTTIEMAREAAGDDWGLFQEYMPEIHKLAELVRADERARMAEQPTTTENNGGKTGWPPGLLQDDCKGLSKWLSNRPDAKRRVREALAEQPAQQESESNKAAYQRGYLDGMAKPCIECADRQWVWLTSEQIQKMSFTAVRENWDWLRFARAIEAISKENNT